MILEKNVYIPRHKIPDPQYVAVSLKTESMIKQSLNCVVKP